MKNVLITGTDSGLGEELMKVFRGPVSPLEPLNNVLGTVCQVEGMEGDGGPDLPPDRVYLRFPSSNAVYNSFAREVKTRFEGSVDILVNNAAMNGLVPIMDLRTEDLDLFHRVNVAGPILITKELIKIGALNPGSIVLFIVSEASWKPMRYSLAYNLSKAALRMAVEQMARELTKDTGVTFLGVSPGLIGDTAMTDHVMETTEAVRGWTRKDFLDYWRKSSVSGVPHTSYHLAELIKNILDSPGLASMSGAVMNLVS